MRKNSLSIIMLLSALPLFTQPSLAADKVTPKQTTTVAAKQESSKVDINTATLAELTNLKGIGDKKAQAIVDYREKQGKFTSVDQLVDVNGIGPATLEANRDMIIVK
ncbi:ComEA family DNA-binding protein [Aeromonas jandaei]|uniref:ComEA family DNA-binding protein n=1 Tax=Aeromonas jandaei TaxID=650 RepID=UPI003B9EC945